MEQSIYQAPASDVIQQDDQNAYGSVEKAIAGDYNFSIGETLSEAWAKTSGAKLTTHFAYLIIFGFFLAVIAASTVLVMVLGASPLLNYAIQIGSNILLYPIWVGLLVLGVRFAINTPPSASIVLQLFHKTIPLFLLYLVSSLFLILGFVLLILPGIYLSVGYMFAGVLMVDKNLGVWQSLETSRKAVTKRWFSFFGLLLALFIINTIAMIPLFLGLIWTIPMTHIAIGIAYRNMFGVEAQTTRL